MSRPTAVVSILPISEPASRLTARKGSKVSGDVSVQELAGGSDSSRDLEKEGADERTPKVTPLDKSGDPLTKVGRAHARVLRCPAVLRFFLYMLPVGLMLAAAVVVGNRVAPDATIGNVPLDLFFGWIEILWVSFWVGRTFVHYTARMIKWICGAISTGLKKYADVLCALEGPLTLSLWLLVCYVSFFPVRRPTDPRDEPG